MNSPALILVAGAHGAGKSVLGGAFLQARGLDYFAPEDFARGALDDAKLSHAQAYAEGVLQGVFQLRRAVKARQSFAMETTLSTWDLSAVAAMTAENGYAVQAWFFGLDSAQRCCERAARRAGAGGYPVAPDLVAASWEASRRNLIPLLPHLAGLRLFDNSAEREPGSVDTPAPQEVLSVAGGRWRYPGLDGLMSVPGWARPIAEAAIEVWGMPTD